MSPPSHVELMRKFTDICGQALGKPKVWIRLRPSPRFDDNVFEVGEEGSTLRLLVDPNEEKLVQQAIIHDHKQNILQRNLTFKVDGVLHNSTQEYTYTAIVDDVILKAMCGTSGMVIAVGPEVSGKSFTLFGFGKKYEYRGVINRALERIFQIADDKRDATKFKIQLSIVEVRQNRVKDLLSMGTSELRRIGKNGPQGMYYKTLSSVDEGVALLSLALSGQKAIPREDYAKYHTIIYINIHGESLLEDGGDSKYFASRVTFSKIASMPKPVSSFDKTNIRSQSQNTGNLGYSSSVVGRPGALSFSSKATSKSQKLILPSNPGFEKTRSYCFTKSGEFGEAIQVRRDLYLLQQMFVRSNEIGKLKRFFPKVEEMEMLLRRHKLTKSEYVRQGKLTHCLQDIANTTQEIRIIITIRPERQYLHSSLEAMRFAEKVKCIPMDIELTSTMEEGIDPSPSRLDEELLILHNEADEQLTNSLAGVTKQVRREKPSLNRQRIYEATDFLEGRIDEIKIDSKEQVRMMFETIRQIWKFTSAQEGKRKHLKKRMTLEKQIEEKEVSDRLDSEKVDLENEDLVPPRVKPKAVFSPKTKTASLKRREKRTNGKLKSGRSMKLKPLIDEPEPSPSLTHVIVDQLISESKMIETLEYEEEECGEDEDDMNEEREVSEVTNETFVRADAHADMKISIMPRSDDQLWTDKDDAWLNFLQTRVGIKAFKELKKQNKILIEKISMHHEIATNVRNVVKKIMHLLPAYKDSLEEKSNQKGKASAINEIASNKYGQGHIYYIENASLNVIKALENGRNELIEKLHIIRADALEQKKLVDKRKEECENEFIEFCTDFPYITFAIGENIIPESYAKKYGGSIHVADHQEIVKNYEFIRKNASKQAKQLLRWLYRDRPDWYPY